MIQQLVPAVPGHMLVVDDVDGGYSLPVVMWALAVDTGDRPDDPTEQVIEAVVNFEGRMLTQTEVHSELFMAGEARTRGVFRTGSVPAAWPEKTSA